MNKKIIFIALTIIALLVIIFISAKAETLPPIDIKGHIEASPPSHILKEPMQIEIQKHMLEHSDGKGAPGVIINYNCTDFKCDSDLIQKLEEFAKKYNNVYVAPFPRMSVKIALTKYGKIKKLSSYDKEAITDFIEN